MSDKGDLDVEIILETLSELVLDRNEVITVTHLSKSQCISPSIARQCMTYFLNKNPDKVKPVFCLSGLIDGKIELQLSSKPKPGKFASCDCFSSNLYSLQSFQPTQLSSLCLPLNDELSYHSSSIQYPADNISTNPSDQGVEIVAKTSTMSDKKANTLANKFTSCSSSVTTNKKCGKSSSIQSMFNKPADSKKSETVSKPLPKTTATSANKKSPIKSSSGCEKPVQGAANQVKENVTETSNKRIAAEETEERSPPVKKPKQNQVSKGRKRVILDDSDDEGANNEGGGDPQESPSKKSEENNDDESSKEADDDSPLKENKYSLSPQKSADTQTTGGAGRRIRRKVLKDVTHVDEDGFLITDKVWAEESCSEDEITNKASSKDNKNAQSNIALPQLIVQPIQNSNEDSAAAKKAVKTVKKSTGRRQQGDLFSFFGKK